MRYGWIAGLALIALPGGAQAMTVAEFLAKTNALKSKGIFAVGSSDIGLLTGEMQTVTTAYRADIVAARAAKRTPHSCPPPRGSAGARMTSKDFLGELERIPVAQRGMSMKTAFYAMMKRRYPCAAG